MFLYKPYGSGNIPTKYGLWYLVPPYFRVLKFPLNLGTDVVLDLEDLAMALSDNGPTKVDGFSMA